MSITEAIETAKRIKYVHEAHIRSLVVSQELLFNKKDEENMEQFRGIWTGLGIGEMFKEIIEGQQLSNPQLMQEKGPNYFEVSLVLSWGIDTKNRQAIRVMWSPIEKNLSIYGMKKELTIDNLATKIPNKYRNSLEDALARAFVDPVRLELKSKL